MSRDLYTHIFGITAFPILDRLNGTQIATCLKFLLASEGLDPREIKARQAHKLSESVRQAREKSQFYRQFWQRRAPGPASLHQTLEGLPVVTKADLKAAAEFFPLPVRGGKAIATLTSGSTGSPMLFYRSTDQESWFWALRMRIWSWGGYRPGDPYLTINLNPRLAWRKRLQDLLFRCTYLTFNADNQDSRRIIEALSRRRIPHLNGFSSSLFVLARYMNERGIRNPGVRGITSTGDTLYPVYREAIESAFGIRVLDYYGAGGEGVHLASQCLLSGNRYHIHPENAVLEFLDNRGPVSPGRPGRIVVTQLDNSVMPLIRYELGDIGVQAREDVLCRCGRTLPMLERIEGRIPDLIPAPDNSFLVPHFFVVLFKNLQSVTRYQVIQTERDRIRVRLVAGPGAAVGAIEAVVQREVSAATRGTLKTEFEWVDEIPLSGAGKRRLVISKFGREILGATAEAPEAAIDT